MTLGELGATIDIDKYAIITRRSRVIFFLLDLGPAHCLHQVQVAQNPFLLSQRVSLIFYLSSLRHLSVSRFFVIGFIPDLC